MLAHEGPGWPLSPVPTARLPVSPSDWQALSPHSLTHTPTPTTSTLPPDSHALKIIRTGLPLINMTTKALAPCSRPLVSPAVGGWEEDRVWAWCPVTPPRPVMNRLSLCLLHWPSRLFEKEECTMLNQPTSDGGWCEKTDTDATLPLAQWHRCCWQEATGARPRVAQHHRIFSVW